MGRPRKDSKHERRNEVVMLRLTPTMKARVVFAAGQKGVGYGEWCLKAVSRLLDEEVPEVPLEPESGDA